MIVHESLYNDLIRSVSSERVGSVPQCHYIVGKKGYGKTALLKQINAYLNEVDKFEPIYVDCLLNPALSVDWMIARENESSRRVVWLLDGMDLFVAGISEKEQFRFRAMIYEENAPIVIGTGNSLSEHFTSYGSPFYDTFSLHILKEMLPSAAALFVAQERMGRERLSEGVIDSVLSEIGYTPFNCCLLAKVNGDLSHDDMMRELLQPLTNFYRMLIANFSVLQRRTIICLLSSDTPLLLKDIRSATNLAGGDLSPQLKSLSSKGIVTQKSLGVKKTGYSISDRAMSAWYRYSYMKDALNV